MTLNSVETEGETKTKYSPKEEEREYDLFVKTNQEVGTSVKEQSQSNEGKTSVKVSPDVSSFCVQFEYALEAHCEAGQRRTMAPVKEFVILKPIG